MTSINVTGSTYFLDDYQYIVYCKRIGQGPLGVKDGQIVYFQYLFLLGDSPENLSINSVDNKDDIIKTVKTYLKLNPTKRATFDGCCITLPDGNCCSIPKTKNDEPW